MIHLAVGQESYSYDGKLLPEAVVVLLRNFLSNFSLSPRILAVIGLPKFSVEGFVLRSIHVHEPHPAVKIERVRVWCHAKARKKITTGDFGKLLLRPPRVRKGEIFLNISRNPHEDARRAHRKIFEKFAFIEQKRSDRNR
jgi:hypothetical protein